MLIYEVNLNVDAEVAEAYAAWLPEHIEAMLGLGIFESVRWYEVASQEAHPKRWSVHYYVKDRARLNAYFEQHAARMREEGLRRFPGRFTAERRILEEKQHFRWPVEPRERIDELDG